MSHRRRTPQQRAARFAFVLLACSLPFWGLGALFPPIRLGALDLPVSAVMFLVPGLTAAVLVGRAGGRVAVGALLRRVLAAPGGWGRSALASLVPALVALVTMALLTDLRPWPVVTCVLLFGVFLIPAAFEEVGWAYCSDALWERFGPVIPGLVVGGMVSLWHLIPLVQAGNDAAWIGAWALGSASARVVMMWCYVRSRAAVPTLVGMHAMANVTAAAVPGYNETSGQLVGGIVMAGLGLALVTVTVRAVRSGEPQPGPPPADSDARSTAPPYRRSRSA